MLERRDKPAKILSKQQPGRSKNGLSAMPTTIQGVSNHNVVQRTINGLPARPTDKSAKSYDVGQQINSNMPIESMKSALTYDVELEALGEKGGSSAEAELQGVSSHALDQGKKV